MSVTKRRSSACHSFTVSGINESVKFIYRAQIKPRSIDQSADQQYYFSTPQQKRGRPVIKMNCSLFFRVNLSHSVVKSLLKTELIEPGIVSGNKNRNRNHYDINVQRWRSGRLYMKTYAQIWYLTQIYFFESAGFFFFVIEFAMKTVQLYKHYIASIQKFDRTSM